MEFQKSLKNQIKFNSCEQKNELSLMSQPYMACNTKQKVFTVNEMFVIRSIRWNSITTATENNIMPKQRFTFTGLEQLKQDKSEIGTYAIFRIFWRETGEKLAEIITNSSLCGSWHYQEKTGLYVQDEGTCQYHLPNSEMGVRKALMARAARNLALRLDLTESEEEKRQIATIMLSLGIEV